MKVSSLAEPTLFLFTKIELPLILISFLSIPLSMRALLSLRSVDSVFADVDMSSLVNIYDFLIDFCGFLLISVDF